MPVANDLSAALPDLVDAESALHEYANNVLGIDYRIADYGAVRDADTTALILQFRTDDYAVAVRRNPSVASTPINVWRPISPYGQSYHDYGAAFDVLITNPGPYVSASAALSALKAAASTVGLRSDVPNDPPHFELPISLSDARQRWLDYNGDAPALPPSVGTSNIAALTTVALIGISALILRTLRR